MNHFLFLISLESTCCYKGGLGLFVDLHLKAQASSVTVVVVEEATQEGEVVWSTRENCFQAIMCKKKGTFVFIP